MATDRWSIGVDIGGTKIQVTHVDKNGKAVQSKVFSTDVKGGPDLIQAGIVTAIQCLERKAGSRPAAVGVGMAGQILAPDGLVKFAPNLGWQNVPLQANLTSRLGVPVVVLNDVRAAAYGEWMHGAGQGVKDLLVLFIGTGIGGGVISGGQLLTGAANAAGELGHTTLLLNGPQCTCGNKGCLEALASGWALGKKAKAAIEVDPSKGQKILQAAGGQLHDVAARHVVEAAKGLDPLAQQLLDEAIDAIACGSASFVNAFNPSRIIFGGGLGMALPQLLEKVEQKILAVSLKAAAESVTVRLSSLGNDAGAIGAAAYALSQSQAKS